MTYSKKRRNMFYPECLFVCFNLLNPVAISILSFPDHGPKLASRVAVDVRVLIYRLLAQLFAPGAQLLNLQGGISIVPSVKVSQALVRRNGSF